tara:strand:+ start:224 stop:409 length:186 start_codon:yes stop_codon:yes gene_type:complete
MKYKELLKQLRTLTKEQLELETLVMIRDKDNFVSLKSGLFYVTEFDEYEEDLETGQPYFSI